MWSVYLSLCLCLSHPWPRRLSKAVFYFLRKKCNWGLLVVISVYLPVCFSKSTRGEKPVEDIPIFSCICVYSCVSRLLAKQNTILTWNLVHILPQTLSKNVFFVFFFWKTTVSRGFSAYLLDCLVFSF